MRIKDKPVRREWVKVLDKKQYSERSGGRSFTKRVFTFEFPDGSSEDMKIRDSHIRPNGIFDLTVINDTGTLVYQELGYETRLIDFERDNHIDKTELNLYEKIYKTAKGKNLLIVVTILLMYILTFPSVILVRHFSIDVNVAVVLIILLNVVGIRACPQ